MGEELGAEANNGDLSMAGGDHGVCGGLVWRPAVVDVCSGDVRGVERRRDGPLPERGAR